MKKCLIIGIILIVICMVLTIHNEFINGPVNINEITNRGLKDENRKVYLDATFVAGTITSDNDNSYYVMFGDGVQYIVYISDLEATKINRYLLDNPEASYRIEGVTKLIPSSMEEDGIKFVNEWLNTNHHHDEEEIEEGHTHNITVDEFYHYFGYVYLNVESSFNFIKLIIYISGILGLTMILYYLNSRYHLI